MTRDVASGRYVGKEAPNLLLEGEMEKSDSETGGQLLDGSRIFNCIFHRVVSPCTRIQK